jgi:hypothetical protein
LFEIAQTPTWRRTQLAAWHPRFDHPNEHLMFIRGFIAETGNPFCCVQHTDTRGEITIRVLGLNDERLSGPRLDAYKEGYDAMSEVFEWIKRLRDPRPDVAPAIKLSLRRSERRGQSYLEWGEGLHGLRPARHHRIRSFPAGGGANAHRATAPARLILELAAVQGAHGAESPLIQTRTGLEQAFNFST